MVECLARVRVRVRTRAWVVLQRFSGIWTEVDTLLTQRLRTDGWTICTCILQFQPCELPVFLLIYHSFLGHVNLALAVPYRKRRRHCPRQCRPRPRRRPYLQFTDARRLRLRESPPHCLTCPKPQKSNRIAAECKKANVSSIGNDDANPTAKPQVASAPQQPPPPRQLQRARTARDDRIGIDSSVHNCAGTHHPEGFRDTNNRNLVLRSRRRKQLQYQGRLTTATVTATATCPDSCATDFHHSA